MENDYGSDFITIMDEDGTEFELEILSSIEFNGCTYLAVTPAGADEDEEELELEELLLLDCIGLHAAAPIIMGTARQRERQIFLNNFIIFSLPYVLFYFLY
jgi:hypothetical protein